MSKSKVQGQKVPFVKTAQEDCGKTDRIGSPVSVMRLNEQQLGPWQTLSRQLLTD